MKIATSLVSLVLLGAPALAQWSTATLSLARRDLAAASAGHIALFAGGSIDADRTPVDVVDLYDARTGAWSTSALSQARSFLSATGVDGKILVAGGADQDDVGVDRVDVYDVETGTWTIDSLSEPRVRPAAATVGRYAVFVGGSDGLFGASSDTVDVYDVTTGSWAVATLPFPVSFAEAAPVGDRVVIVDGNGQLRVTDADGNDVTGDVAALCLKCGNAALLKGSRDAKDSNEAIVQIIQAALAEHELPADAVTLPPAERAARKPAREAVDVVNVAIPRGTQGLIDHVR